MRAPSYKAPSYDASLRATLGATLRELRARPLRTWLLALGWCVLVVGAYFALWRPVRVLLAHHVVGPLLAAAADGTPQLSAAAHATLPHVALRGAVVPTADGTLKLWIDGGRIMLVPMLALALLFPRRPYLLYPWALHLALIAAECLAGYVGAAGWPAGFSAYVFLHGYVMPPATLAFPLLVLLFADPFGVHGARAAQRSEGP